MADKSPSPRPVSARRAAEGARKPRTRAGRWVRRVGLTLGIGLLTLAIAGAGMLIVLYQQTKLPNPNSDFQTQTTFVFYNDSRTKMGNFAVQNRIMLGEDQIPQVVKNAVVAAENRSFWTDPGISVPGMARAAIAILGGGDMQGGSTITQQYIKILYLNSERNLQRKLKELMLASKMGKEVPKTEILTGYLNTIYFGRGAYGIEAASRAYFNTPAAKLTLPQAAVLASVLNNPSLFDPSGGKQNVNRLLDRYRYVLAGMLEMNTITGAQHDAAAAALPKFPDVPVSNRYGGPQGFLMKMVEAELADRGFTESQINGGGLNVTTTFDKKLQDAAVATAQKYTTRAAQDASPAQRAADLHVALASVDTTNGAVLALYGGPDYVKDSRNWATTDRASASTFKAYALVAGLRHGFTLDDRFRGDTFTPPGDSTPVRNEFNHQYGPVSLLRATEDSINTAFVDMVTQIDNGPAEVIKAANDAGVPTGAGWDENDRIALGTAEVSPLENAAGFATFANDGKYNASHVVAKVTDQAGRVLYQAKAAPSDKISLDVASNVNRALSAVVDQGTGARVRDLGHAAAGKTGTSGVGDAITSAWFVAYTRQISTAVMYVAGSQGQSDLDPYKRPGDGTFFGGTYPAMTWLDYMSVAMAGRPELSFTPAASLKPSATPKPASSTPFASTPPASSPAASSPPVSTPPPASSSAPAPSTTRTTPPAPTPPAASSTAPAPPPTSASVPPSQSAPASSGQPPIPPTPSG